MTDFASLLAAGQQADGSIAFDLPDCWRQGRTAYGGLTAATAYRAACGAGEALPPLRSMQIAYVCPIGVGLQASASILRRGKSSAFVEARVTSDGELAMLGTFLFMADRPSQVDIAAAGAPAAPSPEEAAPAMRGKGSAYTSQFEFRHALAPQHRGKPELMRWVRLLAREGLDAVTELLLIGDALPPGISPMMQGPFTASSANWTAHVHGAAPAAHDGWWLLRTCAQAASGGVSSQRMTVWNRTGEAVLSGSQTVSFAAVAG